uniref:Odorant-binding protein n=1 Tax=Galeruca daurica TaxID=1651263 RepID=A0A1U9W508_9CUCU|nr:odorant-binding protein [Galeruca daurica]
MKSVIMFIIICFSFVLEIFAETRTAPNLEYQEARRKCQDDPKTTLDRETLKNAFRGDINTALFGGHAVCIYRHLGILDEQANINKIKLRDSLDYIIVDQRQLDAAVKECSVKKNTPEETAVEIFKCTKRAMAPYLPHYEP